MVDVPDFCIKPGFCNYLKNIDVDLNKINHNKKKSLGLQLELTSKLIITPIKIFCI